MRVLLQRVSEAKVTVEGQVVGEIGPGALLLVGFGHGCTGETVAAMAKKVAELRVFEDNGGKMNLSLLDTSRAALVVSQFTLYADTRKGRRPSFIDALGGPEAKEMYRRFCEELRGLGLTVAEGVFGADMAVSLVNSGPVTIWLASDVDG